MDNSVNRQGSNAQRANILSTSLRIFKNILNWLVNFFQLTEEEKKKAGIYIGNRRDE
jgi:hypothetical protein